MRILVVDDDRGVRESLRRWLELNGYTVDLAEGGQQAMDAVARHRPDVMVLDMTMPRMDGLQVCRRLRNTGDNLLVLALTARDAASDRVAGLDAGADDYLTKPYVLEELHARLRALLRRSTLDRIGNTGAALTIADSEPSAHEAEPHSLPIEASAGDVKRVTSSRFVKRHFCFKSRLTATIIGIVSVVVAAVGLIPSFAGVFWYHDAPDPRTGHINDASCTIIRDISDVNGIPPAVAYMHFRAETRARGQEYTNWLVLTLVLIDGTIHDEERKIEETPGLVMFSLDFLATNGKHNTLLVDVDTVDATVVPAGRCL